MPGPARVSIQRRLLWSECDPARHWHYSCVLRFIEEAETALLHRLGIMHETLPSLPRLNLTVDFLAPMYFGDIADVTMWVDEIRRSTLRYAFTVSRAGSTLARGGVTVAWVSIETGRAAPWPEHLRTLLLTSGPLPEDNT